MSSSTRSPRPSGGNPPVRVTTARTRMRAAEAPRWPGPWTRSAHGQTGFIAPRSVSSACSSGGRPTRPTSRTPILPSFSCWPNVMSVPRRAWVSATGRGGSRRHASRTSLPRAARHWMSSFAPCPNVPTARRPSERASTPGSSPGRVRPAAGRPSTMRCGNSIWARTTASLPLTTRLLLTETQGRLPSRRTPPYADCRRRSCSRNGPSSRRLRSRPRSTCRCAARMVLNRSSASWMRSIVVRIAADGSRSSTGRPALHPGPRSTGALGCCSSRSIASRTTSARACPWIRSTSSSTTSPTISRSDPIGSTRNPSSPTSGTLRGRPARVHPRRSRPRTR